MSTKSLKSCQVTDYWDQTKVVIQHLQGNTAEGKLWKWVHTIHFNWANVQMYLIVQNIMMIVRHKANYTISRKLWSKCFYLLFYDKSRVGNIHSLDTFTFDFYDLLFIYCDMVGPILIQQKHKLHREEPCIYGRSKWRSYSKKDLAKQEIFRKIMKAPFIPII